MIFFFTILFGIGSAYIAYFKPDIFKAVTTVEVGLGRGDGGDILSKATEPGRLFASTEKEIIQSRFLAAKALQKVDFTHRYYITRYLRQVELYKDSPFEVGLLKGYNVLFTLYPVDETHYRLEVKEARDRNGTVWSYDNVHPYGEEVVTEHFHVNIVKTKPMQEDQYQQQW
jgi:hypothetical protein